MAIRESCESGGMADALDLGSSGETRGGSNPPFRTLFRLGFSISIYCDTVSGRPSRRPRGSGPQRTAVGTTRALAPCGCRVGRPPPVSRNNAS